MFGKIEKYLKFSNETIRRHVNTSLSYKKHDPENMIFDKTIKNPVMFESSPYAGESVGVQYPKNLESSVILVSPNKKSEDSVILGQLFQGNKMPKRNNISDYRFTLPNGATEYYDYSHKTKYNVTKQRNIIGVSDSVSYDAVPTIAEMSSYIQVGKSNEDGAQYVRIKVGGQTITLDGSTIVIDNGTGNRKITIGNGTVDVT